MEHLVDGEAEDVAVHGGHAVEVPVLGVLLDLGVNGVAVLEGATDERLGEEAHGGLVRGGGRQLGFFAPIGRAFVLGERGGALGVPEFIERRLDVFGRVQVVLEQKLDCAFARFASFTHETESKVQRPKSKA